MKQLVDQECLKNVQKSGLDSIGGWNVGNCGLFGKSGLKKMDLRSTVRSLQRFGSDCTLDVTLVLLIAH